MAARDHDAEVHCRNFLGTLCQTMEAQGSPQGATLDQLQLLRMCWLAAHFVVALEVSKEAGWSVQAASQALSLLRCLPVLPIDRYVRCVGWLMVCSPCVLMDTGGGGGRGRRGGGKQACVM